MKHAEHEQSLLLVEVLEELGKVDLVDIVDFFPQLSVLFGLEKFIQLLNREPICLKKIFVIQYLTSVLIHCGSGGVRGSYAALRFLERLEAELIRYYR